MTASATILLDLEDARLNLKALVRQEKRARKSFAGGMALLAATIPFTAVTGNGLFAMALFPAVALFLLSCADFYAVMRVEKIKRGNYGTDDTSTSRLDYARQKVRRLERAYSTAVMTEAAK